MKNLWIIAAAILGGLMLAGCECLPSRYELMGTIGAWGVPKNELTLEQRTVFFNNRSVEDVLSRAKIIESKDPQCNNIKLVFMKGTPYEMGFQNGRLNKDDIQANVYHILGIVRSYAKSKGIGEDVLDEVYDRMEPFIPIEDKLEMRGLAHGAGIPLRVIHWFHAIPELSEYAGKKQFLKGRKHNKIKAEPGSLADLKLATCSGVIAFDAATENGDLYHLRVLDWIRRLGAQRYPVIHVYQPDEGNASVSFSYAGFVGCFTGMNEKHIGFGEMGYGNRTYETLEGVPFVFLFKKLLREADTIQEALKIVQGARRTCSYVYQFSGASDNPDIKGVMLVSDCRRFETVADNQRFCDEGDGKCYQGINDVIFAGHETGRLQEFIKKNYGHHNLDTFKALAKVAAMKGNVQDVIMKPQTLEAWVANASSTTRDEAGKACNRKWYYFNFSKLIGR